VYSFPVVQSEIPHGRRKYSNFTLDQAKDFATILKMHPLPVKLTVLDSTTMCKVNNCKPQIPNAKGMRKARALEFGSWVFFTPSPSSSLPNISPLAK